MDKDISDKLAQQLLDKVFNNNGTKDDLIEDCQIPYVYDSLFSDETISKAIKTHNYAQNRQKSLWNEIEKKSKLRRRTLTHSLIAIAAVVIGLFIYIPTINKQTNTETILNNNINKTTLTLLSTGERITLDINSIDEEIAEGFSKIEGKKELIVENASTSKVTEKDVVYSVLSIPRGDEYAITLPDGTKVTLNSDSKLTFPNYFTSNNRIVELEGEAYFDVAKDSSKPFIVRSKDIEIKVLGTKFTVESYESDKFAAATLVEGSVIAMVQEQKISLKPNEQVYFDKKSHKIELKSVDANEYISWVNGHFQFIDKSLDYIMSKVSRFYNYDVIYQNEELKMEQYGIICDKYDKLETFLNSLSIITELDIKIVDDKIYISCKN